MTYRDTTIIEHELEATIDSLRRHLQAMRETQAEELQSEEVDASTPSTKNPPLDPAQTMQVYWLGCRGLADISAALPGQPMVARIGCTVERNIEVRLRTASADSYGSWARDQTGRLREAAGFSSWVMQAIATTRPALDAAITARTRTIEVTIPEGMTRRGFDRALHVALSNLSLETGHPRLERYTRYSMGADRMSRAIELYVGLDPRRDGDRLLGIIERILQTHREKPGTASGMSGRAETRTAGARGTSVSRAPMTATQVAAMRARLRYGTGRN